MVDENEHHYEQPEDRGKLSPDSPQSAANDIGGSAVTDPTHDEGYAERQHRNAREEARLKEWAEKRGLLGGGLPENKHQGGEHAVEFDERRQRFIKGTLPEVGFGYGIYLSNTGQQATPGEYLDRLALHNRIFGDDIKVERVVPLGAGKFSIVTSQSALQGEPATPRQIQQSMRSKGFEPIADGVFYNRDEGLLIHDMHPRNAVFSGGRAVPIDTSVQRVTPEFADWISKNAQILKNQGKLRGP